MNAWGLSPDSVPAEALPVCCHGHEVALVRHCAAGYVVICAQCGAVGTPIDVHELQRRGWRLDDIDELGAAR